MNQFPPNPRVSHKECFEFFGKFAEIFASQGGPPVLTTPMPKKIAAGINDTCGKFASGINNTGDKFRHQFH
jgi:hypothetical protein